MCFYRQKKKQVERKGVDMHALVVREKKMNH